MSFNQSYTTTGTLFRVTRFLHFSGVADHNGIHTTACLRQCVTSYEKHFNKARTAFLFQLTWSDHAHVGKNRNTLFRFGRTQNLNLFFKRKVARPVKNNQCRLMRLIWHNFTNIPSPLFKEALWKVFCVFYMSFFNIFKIFSYLYPLCAISL